MRKLINLTEIELALTSTLDEINTCFAEWTPKARSLKFTFITYISDIELIKDMSYTLKHELAQLLQHHDIPEHYLFDINGAVYSLECDLVNLSKYDDKVGILTRWFSNYHELKGFFAEISKNPWKPIEPMPSLQEKSLEETIPEAKIIKFSHLL